IVASVPERLCQELCGGCGEQMRGLGGLAGTVPISYSLEDGANREVSQQDDIGVNGLFKSTKCNSDRRSCGKRMAKGVKILATTSALVSDLTTLKKPRR